MFFYHSYTVLETSIESSSFYFCQNPSSFSRDYNPQLLFFNLMLGDFDKSRIIMNERKWEHESKPEVRIKSTQWERARKRERERASQQWQGWGAKEQINEGETHQILIKCIVIWYKNQRREWENVNWGWDGVNAEMCIATCCRHWIAVKIGGNGDSDGGGECLFLNWKLINLKLNHSDSMCVFSFFPNTILSQKCYVIHRKGGECGDARKTSISKEWKWTPCRQLLDDLQVD